MVQKAMDGQSLVSSLLPYEFGTFFDQVLDDFNGVIAVVFKSTQPSTNVHQNRHIPHATPEFQALWMLLRHPLEEICITFIITSKNGTEGRISEHALLRKSFGVGLKESTNRGSRTAWITRIAIKKIKRWRVSAANAMIQHPRIGLCDPTHQLTVTTVVGNGMNGSTPSIVSVSPPPQESRRILLDEKLDSRMGPLSVQLLTCHEQQ
mmetsp:Transcript_24974/g.61475  ORF Transcript_24974/g.61475 Transcript_24974/m.61475 type:complete len:207 (+) Transcript_24974:2162-2782(+)